MARGKEAKTTKLVDYFLSSPKPLAPKFLFSLQELRYFLALT